MNNQTAAPCRSSDEVFEQVLEEITARIQAGHLIDLNACVAKHPEYAERLGRLLPAMQVLVAFGNSQSVTENETTPTESISAVSGVLGDFRIIREIGRGGMGVVYEADQISIGRPVALKVLPFASMLDERRLARFRNEVRAAGQLHHTNIVPVYAVGSDRGVHFYAMQLVNGQSLAEIIAAMKPGRSPSGAGAAKSASHAHKTAAGDTAIAALPTLRSSGSAAFFRNAAQLTVQAAEALEHAHSCGVVHRDIKPSNLLVDERGCLWLTDFGLASIDAGSELTMSGDLLGTLRYMSPEQTLGSRVVLDHRTDIYSLGITLYELLTLRPAFETADRGELLRQIAVVEPRSPQRIDPTIPVDLETIVLKAISKDASSRYASAQHFADDLRRFLENKPIEARRPSFVDRSRKWVTRHAQLVAMSAAALAIVAIVGALATYSTLNAYTSEANQRAAAQANLQVASQIIDRMLSRSSDERYHVGDIEQAEMLAADAAKFYDELLRHSDDTELRFNAAVAHGDIAHLWELIGRHEKAGIAARRAGELLQRLATGNPNQPKYFAEMASNYNQIGLIDWSLDRPIAAEPSWRQAWEIYTELSTRFPNEPAYQSGVADMLANLGAVCSFTDRCDEAEEYYRRAKEIDAHLPAELKTSAAGLANEAGSCTNQAELARLRGQYDRALELLAQAIPLHKQALEKWPSNPMALDCYFHTLWNIAECNLGVRRHEAASVAVESYVQQFPDRLQAYHEGAEQLLQSAAIAGESQSFAKDGQASNSYEPTPAAKKYLQRAHELIIQASDARNRTQDTVNRFAWFLLTCQDKSFRDPRQALALAKAQVKDVPERGDAWFTLALAYYHTGQWSVATDAVERSIKLAPGGESNVYDWVLLSMVRSREGRTQEARQWCEKASKWISANHSKDHDLLTLADDACELLQEADRPSDATLPNKISR